MKRRNFIKASIVSSALVGLGGYGYITTLKSQQEVDLSLAGLLKRLAQYKEGHIQLKGDWNLAQVFSHCAQSVSYSMLGYPTHKSEIFKTTIGTMAFSLFSHQGKMAHSLNEVIPGAPIIQENINLISAYDELITILNVFDAYQGTLHPHFAYGALTKAQYNTAHILHINNHLENFSIRA